MPGAEAPFRHVGIVGAGLIGGSVALAARRVAPGLVITVVDRPDVTDAVLARKTADRAAASVEALGDVDLVVLAAPIPAILEVLTEGRLPNGAVVTDVGSTKRDIEAAATAAGTDFVGGHPMAGRERGGFEAASADLFDGCRWFLVPSRSSGPDSVARVSAFVRVLGAVPHITTSESHDRAMAYVSHLPQLVASLLMRHVESAVGPIGLASAGRGLEDATRLASSPAGIWQGILASNRDFVGEAAAALARDLASLGARLDDAEAVGRLFDAASVARERWLSSRGDR